MPRPLPTYLRNFRLQSGLSQEDVALLLGVEGGSVVSKHEDLLRIPPLETALAYEIVYGTPVRELFAGRYQEVERRVHSRVVRLKRRLRRASPTRSRDRKLASLRSIGRHRDP